jgi:hypothetical protein
MTNLQIEAKTVLMQWLSRLSATAETKHAKEQAAREERARAEAQGVRERLTPLDERLTRLLATIPIEVQREGVSLSSLQTSLRGRHRGKCHPGELGVALRRAGFIRSRNWRRSSDGFRAVWRRVDS